MTRFGMFFGVICTFNLVASMPAQSESRRPLCNDPDVEKTAASLALKEQWRGTVIKFSSIDFVDVAEVMLRPDGRLCAMKIKVGPYTLPSGEQNRAYETFAHYKISEQPSPKGPLFPSEVYVALGW